MIANRQSPSNLTNEQDLKSSLKSIKWLKSQPKKLRKFYQSQNELIISLLGILSFKNNLSNANQNTANNPSENRLGDLVVKISLGTNVLLFALKVFAAIWSSSLSVIASAVDSSCDLISCSILFFVQKFAKSRSPYRYPQGKSRSEPIGVALFGAAMCFASLQLLVTGVKNLINDLTGNAHSIRFDLVTILVLSATLTAKGMLLVYCLIVMRKSKQSSPAVKALAQDHLMDLITNGLGLLAVTLAFYEPYLIWLDSAGMVALGLAISLIWLRTVFAQMRQLLGKTAPAQFIAKLIYLSGVFHSEVLQVDKVLAYHFGMRYLVEVDIVLPETYPLKKAHDIGEQLEVEIERMSEVERAFVHLDYETTHKPEHKIFY